MGAEGGKGWGYTSVKTAIERNYRVLLTRQWLIYSKNSTENEGHSQNFLKAFPFQVVIEFHKSGVGGAAAEQLEVF